MERTARFMFAAVLSVTVLHPRSVCAMDFEQFVNMTAEDQKHYLTFMVREARTLLIETGHPDDAKSVEALFRDILRGSKQSPGEAQFEFVVAGAQRFKNSPGTPASMRGPLQISVASLLSQVLVNNGIKLTGNFTQTLDRGSRNRVFYQKPD